MIGFRQSIWKVTLLGLILSLMYPVALVQGQEVGNPAAINEPSIYFAPTDQEESSLEAEVAPGESVVFSVDIGSLEGISFDAVAYAADAETLRNGGFAVKGLDSEPTGLTTWLDFPTRTLNITPGVVDSYEVVVTVPPETEPGEYVAGLAVETAEPVGEQDEEAAYQYNVLYRTVVGVRIVVPGELTADVEIQAPAFVLEGSTLALTIPLSNEGNYSTAPEARIVVLNENGDAVINSEFQMGRIYGGHDTEIYVSLPTSLDAGDYSVEVTLEDEGRNVSVTHSQESVSLGDRLLSPPEQRIEAASVTPAPSADEVVYLDIVVDLVNNGDTMTNGQLTLVATKDGEEVEHFALAEAFVLETGNRSVTTRYIPTDGFTSGTWTFELQLERVDDNGTEVVVDSIVAGPEIHIP